MLLMVYVVFVVICLTCKAINNQKKCVGQKKMNSLLVSRGLENNTWSIAHQLGRVSSETISGNIRKVVFYVWRLGDDRDTGPWAGECMWRWGGDCWKTRA